eukprot:TRINITY_DN33560_c0_g1_i1.p2 TRINITY_DN33560_c0_g1~~TRINITY_DN33560_c0_g1_i1.p2  ORF type:complete len:156 (+),score=48.81 TRINITY_DN33560_c0_g1_i1:60-527(+)
MQLWLGFVGMMANFGIMVFNQGFVHASELAAPDPRAFSPMSQVLIVLWGLAYFAADYDTYSKPAVSRSYWIWLVFAVEKAVYVARYLDFLEAHPTLMAHVRNDLAGLTTIDQLASVDLFYASYGLVDGALCFLFFTRWFLWFVGGGEGRQKEKLY